MPGTVPVTMPPSRMISMPPHFLRAPTTSWNSGGVAGSTQLARRVVEVPYSRFSPVRPSIFFVPFVTCRSFAPFHQHRRGCGSHSMVASIFGPSQKTYLMFQLHSRALLLYLFMITTMGVSAQSLEHQSVDISALTKAMKSIVQPLIHTDDHVVRMEKIEMGIMGF